MAVVVRGPGECRKEAWEVLLVEVEVEAEAEAGIMSGLEVGGDEMLMAAV